MKFPLYIFLFLFYLQGVAQNRLTGKITDQTTKEPLIGATIYLSDLRQGASTNVTGTYVVNNLPKGRFLVQIRLVGYSPIIRNIEIKGATTLDFELLQSATELGTVLVTGVSAATEMRRNPVATNIIDQEDLQQHAGTNIIDAIARTPGVSQITTGAAISKPVIRGLSSNRVVTLNNGMRQEGQQWGDEHGIEVDEYSVDRAEVIKGPGSIMYGSDAMAGVVNFIAADPVEEGKILGSYSSNYQTNNNLIGNSLMNAGNLNGFNWQTRLSQKIAGNYQNRYDGRVFNTGFKELNGSGYVGVNKSWGFSHLSVSSFNQRLGLTEGERDKFGNFLKVAQLNGQEVEVPVTNDDLKGYGITEPNQKVNHLRFASQNNFILGASRITLNLDWQRNLRREFGHQEDAAFAGHKEETPSLFFDLQTVSYDLKYFLPETGNWKTTLGSGGMRQQNRNRALEFLIPDYKMADFGFFGFTQRSFEKWHLSGGARFDRRIIEAERLLLDANEKPTVIEAAAEEVKFTGFKRNFSNISGSAGASFDISKKLTAKLNMARGFRAPNIAELSSNGRHEGTLRYEIGNPDLKPETSFQSDIGLSLNTDHVSLDINGFNNSIQKYIFPEKLESVLGGDSLSGKPDDLAATFKYNQGNARLYGGEISIDMHPHPLDWLHFENSLSFVRGIQLNQPHDSLRNLPFIPAPRLQSEIRVNFKKTGAYIRNWFARLEAEHTFAQNNAFTAYNTETTTPGYTLINMGAGLDVPNGPNTTLFSMYITANNIFDVAYQNHLSRLKYAPVNEATGRPGIFNMGRNVSIKLMVPLAFKK